MFEIFGALFILDYFKSLFNSNNSSSMLGSVKYASYMFSIRLQQMLFNSEGMHKTAYPDYVGVATIGKGSTLIVRDNGSLITAVKLGMSLKSLAKQYFNLNLVTEKDYDDFANRLMKNHVSSKSAYPIIAKKLDSLGINFDENLALALHDFGYQSGSGFIKSYSGRSLFETNLMLKINDKKEVARLYGNMRISYLKTFAKNAWNGGYFGISKRIFKCCWLIKYGNFPNDQVEKKYGSSTTSAGWNKLKNDFYSEFGIII